MRLLVASANSVSLLDEDKLTDVIKMYRNYI